MGSVVLTISYMRVRLHSVGTMEDVYLSVKDRRKTLYYKASSQFYVLFAVLLDIILEIKPIWCRIFLSIYISFLYMFRATNVPIIRKNNFIYATLDICHSVWMTVWYAGSILHTRQSSMQSDKYQVSPRYSYFS
jgi:hypothetical protein